jgi:hypothetical protein
LYVHELFAAVNAEHPLHIGSSAAPSSAARTKRLFELALETRPISRTVSHNLTDIRMPPCFESFKKGWLACDHASPKSPFLGLDIDQTECGV